MLKLSLLTEATPDLKGAHLAVLAANATPSPPKDHPKSLAEIYHSLFEVVRADTPELRREAHRLRYQVYCIENQFLPIEDNPGGWERDAFDAHSVQAVLIHRPSGAIAGTVRLVLPTATPRPGCLPIHAVGYKLMHEAGLPIERTTELSRFAISKQFRRRAGDGLYGGVTDADAPGEDRRRIIPHLSLGLISAAIRMGIDSGMEFVCATMEPTLLRLLTRLGVHFIPLGPVVDFHGPRQPCYADGWAMLARVKRERPDVWDVIGDRGKLPDQRPVESGDGLRRAGAHS
jgi:N-acyl amino acid synthase of PEP-CTERM/exosortase system